MKKHLTAFILFGLSTSLFAIECPLDYFKKLKKIKCPESVIKESTKEQKDLLASFKIEIQSLKEIKVVYEDVLKKLHDTDNLDNFINKQSFEDFTNTQISEKLLTAKVLKKETEYNKYLEKVDINNPLWCTVVDELEEENK